MKITFATFIEIILITVCCIIILALYPIVWIYQGVTKIGLKLYNSGINQMLKSHGININF